MKQVDKISLIKVVFLIVVGKWDKHDTFPESVDNMISHFPLTKQQDVIVFLLIQALF